MLVRSGPQGRLQPNWTYMFTLRFHQENVPAAKWRYKVPLSQKQERFLVQLLPSARAAQSRTDHSPLWMGTVLLLTAQGEGECLTSVTVSQICGRSPSLLQTPNQKNRRVSLSSSVKHHHVPLSTWVGSTCTREAWQWEVSKPLHHPVCAWSPSQASNIQLSQSVT